MKFDSDTIADLVETSDSNNTTTKTSSQKPSQNIGSQLSHLMEEENRVDDWKETAEAATTSVLGGPGEGNPTQIGDLD